MVEGTYSGGWAIGGLRQKTANDAIFSAVLHIRYAVVQLSVKCNYDNSTGWYYNFNGNVKDSSYRECKLLGKS